MSSRLLYYIGEMLQRRYVRWDKIQILYITYNRLIKMLQDLALWSLEQRRHDANASVIIIYLNVNSFIAVPIHVLSDFINLTQVHNFTVSAQDIFTFRRLSLFTVSFTGILQLLVQIMKHFALYY